MPRLCIDWEKLILAVLSTERWVKQAESAELIMHQSGTTFFVTERAINKGLLVFWSSQVQGGGQTLLVRGLSPLLMYCANVAW